MMANRLRRRHDPAQVSVAVVDKDDRHVYQPGLLFVPFGLAYADEIVRSRRRQLREGIDFHETEVEQVVLEDDVVRLANGPVLDYDVLVLATGAVLRPEETRG